MFLDHIILKSSKITFPKVELAIISLAVTKSCLQNPILYLLIFNSSCIENPWEEIFSDLSTRKNS